MTGSPLIRAILLALCLACSGTAAMAQPPAAPDGASGSGSSGSEASGSEASGSESAPPESWFVVDRLNPGLGPAPDALDRTTPMGALESFLAETRSGQPEGLRRAAHLLDLSRVPEAQQATRGPVLARKLGELIENVIWIDWSSLPDRPDALVEPVAGGTPRAGDMRRSVVLGRIDMGDHSVPIRLRRVKPEGADPAWVFAPQSVDNIDALYEQHGPGWLQHRLPENWKRQAWLSLQLWEFVALPAAVLGAVLVFALLRWLLGIVAHATPWRAAMKAVLAARTPLALLGPRCRSTGRRCISSPSRRPSREPSRRS